MMPIIEQLRIEIDVREKQAAPLREQLSVLEDELGRMRAALLVLGGHREAPSTPAAPPPAPLDWQEVRPELEPAEADRAERVETNRQTIRERVLVAIGALGGATVRQIADSLDLFDQDIEDALGQLFVEKRICHEWTGSATRLVLCEPEPVEPGPPPDAAEDTWAWDPYADKGAAGAPAPRTADPSPLDQANPDRPLAPAPKAKRFRRVRPLASAQGNVSHDAIAKTIADAGPNGCKASVIREAHSLSKAAFAAAIAAMTAAGVVRVTGRNNGTRYALVCTAEAAE